MSDSHIFRSHIKAVQNMLQTPLLREQIKRFVSSHPDCRADHTGSPVLGNHAIHGNMG